MTRKDIDWLEALRRVDRQQGVALRREARRRKRLKPVRVRRLVQCPICDVKFRENTRNALVLIGAGDWKGMDVIRCPKCLLREQTL